MKNCVVFDATFLMEKCLMVLGYYFRLRHMSVACTFVRQWKGLK